MSEPHPLEQFENTLRTRAGKAFPGQRAVFRGHDLHTEFEQADWVDLYLFSITGRRLSAAQLKVLQSMWIYTSYPDTRLWCNRVAALTASTRGTGGQALAASLAASEAAIYGRGPDICAADFLVRAMAQRAAGEDLEQIVREELKRHTRLMGYGRPMAADFVDERLPVTLATMEREGVPIGPHFKLAFEIEDMLEHLLGRRLPMTYASVVVAVPLDMGLTPVQCYMYLQLAFLAGVIPCYLEALERPPGATYPLRCSAIVFDGPAPRAWD